ncbi:MAG: hypothetical protein ACYC7F_05700 [Gemmatimonadaceae bacterium]
MTAPVVEPTPAVPRERGWRSVVGGLALLLLLPAMPPFSVVFPVAETALVLVPVLAACALAGWKAGGRLLLAVIWVAFAAWVVAAGAVRTDYSLLARGWGVLVAVSFAVWALVWPNRPFLPRALATLGLALLVGGLSTLVAPGGASRVRQVVAGEVMRRADAFDADWKVRLTSKDWQDFRAANAESAAWFERTLDEQRVMVRGLAERSPSLFPALLALETLAALGLAWALYHRVGRARIGAPLARLREFRFDDQFIWGLVGGLLLVVVPGLGAARDLGANLLVFFGALYALRGAGVALFLLAPGRVMTVVLVGASVLFAGAAGVIFLGLGLGDTWLDWRRRTRPST